MRRVLHESIKHRQQPVLRGLHFDPRVFQVQIRLKKFRALAPRFLHRILQLNVFHQIWRRDRSRWHNLDARHVLRQQILGDVVQQYRLLLQFGRLRHDQILLVGRQLRFRCQHVQRRHGSNFQLFLVVTVKFLRNADGRFLHLHVFAVENQFPVIVRSLRHGRNHLLGELRIRHLYVVAGLDNVTSVRQNPEAVQQGLRECRRHHWRDGRIEKQVWFVRSVSGGIEHHGEIRSGVEALRVPQIDERRVRIHYRHRIRSGARRERIVHRNICVLPPEVCRHDRIERHRGR